MVSAVLGGCAAGWLLWGSSFWHLSSDVESASHEERSPTREKAPEDLARLLPDGAAPLPATSAEVIAEVHHLVDWLVARYPEDPDSYEVAARVQFWLGDSESALRYWEKCIRLDARYAYAYHGMGLVAAKKGNHSEAVGHFRKVLRLAPDAAAPQLDLATALITVGEMEEAASVLERYVKTAQAPAGGWILLGKAYLNLGRVQQAKGAYQAAVRLQANSADARFGLATACARLGESERAADEMSKFKELMATEKAVRKAQRSGRDDVEEMRAGLAATYRIVSQVCGPGRASREAERFVRRANALSSRTMSALPSPDDPRSGRMSP